MHAERTTRQRSSHTRLLSIKRLRGPPAGPWRVLGWQLAVKPRGFSLVTAQFYFLHLTHVNFHSHFLCVCVCVCVCVYVREGSVSSVWSLRSTHLYPGRRLSSWLPSPPPLLLHCGCVPWSQFFFSLCCPPVDAPHVTGVSSTLGHLQTELAHGWPHFTAWPFPLCHTLYIHVYVYVCAIGEGWTINSHHFLPSIKTFNSVKSMWPSPTKTIIASHTSNAM